MDVWKILSHPAVPFNPPPKTLSYVFIVLNNAYGKAPNWHLISFKLHIKEERLFLNMDEFNKHVLERLTNLELELQTLRETTWPVCQGLLDKNGPFENRKEKLGFFKHLFLDEIKKLLKLKARFMGTGHGTDVAELQWITIDHSQPFVPQAP